MDIVFKCPHCKQELEVDYGAGGHQITCPACSKSLTIPQPDSTNLRVAAGAGAAAATREHKALSVPVSDKPVAPLIQKSLPSLENSAKDGAKTIRIKTLRHSDCREVGHDNFDKVASELLLKIGEENIVSITAINYSYIELGTQKMLTDFGVLIVYRGSTAAEHR